MARFRVLIVEDDFIIATDLTEALTIAGCEVIGTAASEAQALLMGEQLRPNYAVVDIRLSPGDGRVVAKAFTERFGTAVLFATSHCGSMPDLAQTGALACLAKPYQPEDVFLALEVLEELQAGHTPDNLPRQMNILA
jgi:ActR/RegA family two-component response regulator